MKSAWVSQVLTRMGAVLVALFCLFCIGALTMALLWTRPVPDAEMVYTVQSIKPLENRDTAVTTDRGTVIVLGPFAALAKDTLRTQSIPGRTPEKKMLCNQRTSQCGLITSGRLSKPSKWSRWFSQIQSCADPQKEKTAWLQR